ncbi:MAG: PP2C family serine/threonine-protein phosphatase [Terracidiphilus sp.]|jgi:protein phosphatase
MTEEFPNSFAPPPPTPADPFEPVPFEAASPAAAAPAPQRIAVSALSDIGCVRTNNEDAFGYDESLGIFVVCDGMGGMASGEVASALAVSGIINSFAATTESGAPISTRLLVALNAANSSVWENGQIPENRGMGTTAVVAALDGNKLIVGNVGDSRAYIIQDGQCVQLTVDHSYINELIRNGTLTIENAHTADLRGMESVITRAVGVAAEVQPDFFSVDLKPGTAVLLATDGLTRYLVQEEIASVLASSTFESACFNLIDLAKRRGGQDNITCILLLAMSN